ncbi:MAG: LamG domain-containing protein [Gallionella sp.]|nr:LamG domain-containing protein [Gallionella sp.]MDD4958122.1 LamG domain-containing protein [Gallionella sp.]
MRHYSWKGQIPYSLNILKINNKLDDMKILSMVLLCLLMAFSSLNGWAGTSNGLIANWSFDDCTANDSSGNGNNGVINGTVSCELGKKGQAMIFNGVNNFLKVPNSASLNPDKQLTISLWMRPDDLSGDWYTIIHKGGAGTNCLSNREYAVFLNGKEPSLYQMTAGDNNCQQFFNSKANGISKGQWVHYVGIVDLTNHVMKIYINGQLSVQQAITYNSFTQNAASLLIAYTEENFGYFKGALDEIQLYNRALSDAEITNLYQLSYTNVASTNAATANANGLIANWSFDDCTANDSSSNGNNGVINGTISCQQGKKGQAMIFNGSDSFIKVPNSPSLNPDKQLTISLWMRPDDLSRNWYTILHKGGAGTNCLSNREYAVFLYGTNRSLYQMAAGDNACQEFGFKDNVVSTGQWVHYVGIVDLTNHIMKIYINGQLSAQQPINRNSFTKNSASLLIAYTEENFGYFKGALDEIQLYNHVLSDAEIANLYQVSYTNVASTNLNKCCWNRAIQSCNSNSDCDGGGEGCRVSGTPTNQYGSFACSTCESQGQVYDGTTGSCKSPTATTTVASQTSNAASTDAPSGYTKCAGELGQYYAATTTDIAYGANGTYAYKSGVSGNISFSPSTFGYDPVPNVVKAGYCKPSDGTSISAGSVAQDAAEEVLTKPLSLGGKTLVKFVLDEMAQGENPFCWKGSYGRGVGRLPSTCAPGQVMDGGLCYDKCAPGFTSDGAIFCYKKCPAGSKFSPGLCQFSGVGSCPSGLSGLKPSCINSAGRYSRGAGKPMICESDEQNNAGLCYNSCKANYSGNGPVCWGTCPSSQPVVCGAGCAINQAACASETTNMVMAPLQLAANIVMAVATGGTANAAKAAARSAIKSGLSATTRALAKAAFKSLKQDLLAKIRTKMSAKLLKDYAKENAEAVMNKAAEQLAAAAMSDGGAVDVMQVLGDIDPTGVMDVVSAYNKPTCHVPDEGVPIVNWNTGETVLTYDNKALCARCSEGNQEGRVKFDASNVHKVCEFSASYVTQQCYKSEWDSLALCEDCMYKGQSGNVKMDPEHSGHKYCEVNSSRVPECYKSEWDGMALCSNCKYDDKDGKARPDSEHPGHMYCEVNSGSAPECYTSPYDGQGEAARCKYNGHWGRIMNDPNHAGHKYCEIHPEYWPSWWSLQNKECGECNYSGSSGMTRIDQDRPGQVYCEVNDYPTCD